MYAFICRGVGVYGHSQNFCFEIHLAQILLFIKLPLCGFSSQNTIPSQQVTIEGKLLKI